MQCHINYLISTTKTFVRESFTSNIARLLTSSLARHFPHSPSRAVNPAPCSLACSSPPRATITAKEGNRIRWTWPLVSRALFPRAVCALSSSPARSGHALHCWQRCLHRLVAGYGKYWGCVPCRKPRIASLAYLHSAPSSPPSLPQGSESPPPAAMASTLQEKVKAVAVCAQDPLSVAAG
jgi:hypothetical protein